MIIRRYKHHTCPANSLDPYIYNGGPYCQQALFWWKARHLIMLNRVYSKPSDLGCELISFILESQYAK